MNIAIIPARGGSKRIPRKNIKDFCGKPMITYAIEAANLSGLFEHVVVSTDDEEIANVSRERGGEVPFMRPPEMADDYTTTVPVVAQAIKECLKLGWPIEYVCCIYPGVPFIEVGDLKEGLSLLKSSNADYCFPVTEFPSAPQRGLRRDQNAIMSPFYPQFELTRTQDLEPVFYDAGQFYWGKMIIWLENRNVQSSGLGLIIPSWRVVDIDTNDDWERAERLYNAFIKESNS